MSAPLLPRRHRKGFGWPVDLARDPQSNCEGPHCGAAIYWVEIVTAKGEVKMHPLSEALARRDGEQVYLGSHYADCPDADRFRST